MLNLNSYSNIISPYYVCIQCAFILQSVYIHHLNSAGKNQQQIKTGFMNHEGQSHRSSSPRQIDELEHVYQNAPYIDGNVKVELAKKFNLSENQILRWFKSRRSKNGITRKTWKNHQVNILTKIYKQGNRSIEWGNH